MVEFYKEKLTFYRLLLTLVITADTGCMAWLFTQYMNCTTLQIWTNLAAITCLSIVVVKTLFSIKAYQDKLRSLK